MFSAIGTFLAVIVALGLGVFPPMLKRKHEQKLATKRSYELLKTIKLVLKKYQFYNTQKIVQNGVTQYQYDVNNVKSMTINIDLYQEARNLNRLAENLNNNIKVEISDTLDLLVSISSGFPFDKTEWDRLQVLINNSIVALESNLNN